MKYWIKERYNIQTGRYYVPMGQGLTKEAKKHERTIYGLNIMLSFNTKEEYEQKIAQLKAAGESVHSESQGLL